METRPRDNAPRAAVKWRRVRMMRTFPSWYDRDSMRLSPTTALIAAFLAAVSALAAPDDSETDAARADFGVVFEVFTHPRCVNCHPAGDRPLQTDRGVAHSMNVARGPDSKGRPGLRCQTCHQQRPLAGAHMPPGAPLVEPFPEWSLAPIEMAIEGRSPGELCRQLKDRKRTGGLGLEDILFHLRKDPLVLWAFDPGAGRTPIRIPHAAFVRAAAR